MKKIVLSFDDGRADFYTRAYPLLSKHNMPSTLNVTSGFILTPAKFVFSSADDKAMTAEEVKECYFDNVEIACHGFNHINAKADLLRNVEELEDMGIDVKNIGFASTRSITEYSNIQPFLEDKFKFRKAYCRLQIVYKPIFGFIVNTLYPIRKYMPPKVKAILYMEAMKRNEI